MDTNANSGERLISFKSPKRFLSNLDPAVTAKVVASAADVALIVDNGVIKDVAVSAGELTKERYDSEWRGKKWIETVTVESRSKIEELLKGGSSTKPHWRQVNHPSAAGQDVPIKYTAVRTGEGDRIVALGRDLRALSTLQQRLVDAHQGLERDYNRLRETEARYRLLFQAVSEPVMIIDSTSYLIEEANPAAERFFGKKNGPLSGQTLLALFPKKSQRTIELTAADVLSNGAGSTDDLPLKGVRHCRLSFSLFQIDNKMRFIVRVVGGAEETADEAAAQSQVLSVIQDMPDGLVVAGEDLRILQANQAFYEMARLPGTRQAEGERLEKFLGRSATDINVLLSNIKNHGSVRNFSTVLRDQFGSEERVEVSAVQAPSEDGPIFGFAVRNVARRLEAGQKIGEHLPQSVDQLTGLVGKVSLKEIVRESTDLIERLCIEAALEITDDNRASAAEMLGLSRQGLYSKLKRFGFDG